MRAATLLAAAAALATSTFAADTLPLSGQQESAHNSTLEARQGRCFKCPAWSKWSISEQGGDPFECSYTYDPPWYQKIAEVWKTGQLSCEYKADGSYKRTGFCSGKGCERYCIGNCGPPYGWYAGEYHCFKNLDSC